MEGGDSRDEGVDLRGSGRPAVGFNGEVREEEGIEREFDLGLGERGYSGLVGELM